MGLFSFLKRKPESEETVVPANGIKALAEGILFEDDGIFLKWGSDPEAGKYYAKKEFRADRVIYLWGEKSILGGLRLPFKTICWHHKQHGDTRAFESLEFSLEGADAKDKFQELKDYIEPILADPRVPEDIKQGDLLLEWRIKAVKISLSFFNKENPKVLLEIGWWL